MKGQHEFQEMPRDEVALAQQSSVAVPPQLWGGRQSPLDARSQSLQDGWVKFIDRYRWQWFATLTFREEIHPEAASKAFRYWVRLLNVDLFGKNWKRNRKADGGVRWVCALEWQKRGVLHFHALLGCDHNLNRYAQRKYYAMLWDKIGGFAKIDPITRQSDAVYRYVAKYVVKGGEIDVAASLRNAEDWEDSPVQSDGFIVSTRNRPRG